MKVDEILICYRLLIDGSQFGEIDFSDTTPEFKNVLLKPIAPESQYYELLIKKRIYSESEEQLKIIFSEAYTEADRFKYIFSQAAGVKIFEFKFIGYYKNDILIQDQKSTIKSVSGFASNPVVGDQLKIIKQNMGIDYDLSEIQMFYDAATVIDPVIRFISLYSLMLNKYNDSQRDVDDAILSFDSTIFQNKRKDKYKKYHIYETIFTKLRNEMSHKEKG